MQDRKPDLILASEEDAKRYWVDGMFSGLPYELKNLESHPLALDQKMDSRGLDHIHLSISSTYRHLVQWMGRYRNGMHYPIGSVMVILNASDFLYPDKKRGRPSTNFDKKAYQREYMRRRRARAKAEKEVKND